MARKAKKKNVGSHVFWRNGRAYGDFRDYEDVGGGKRGSRYPGLDLGHEG